MDRPARSEASTAALLPEHTVFRTTPADSETALVVFSAAGAKRDFHLFPVLDDLPGFSKLYVRDPRSHWYNDGLPGVGRTLADVAERLERELVGLGAKRAIAVGPSMGAYGAILFGCMIGVERAIAFAPQTLLDRGLHHAPPEGVALQAPDLRPVIDAAPATRVEIVAGWDDHDDVFHAQRVTASRSVRVLGLPGRTHRSGIELAREGNLDSFVHDLILGRTPEICEVDPQLEPDVERRIAETAYATQRGDWAAVAASIRPVAEGRPDWALPNHSLGRALAGMKLWSEAELFSRRAIRANPMWPDPRGNLVKALLAQGRPDDAAAIARDGLRAMPEWAHGHLLLARCLRTLGRTAAARREAHRAVAIRPNLADVAAEFL